MIEQGNVVADTTFYSLFYNELADTASLYQIMESYPMIVGDKVRDELARYISSDGKFSDLAGSLDPGVNLPMILSDFYGFLQREFPDLGSWIDDAEFEVMGISYHLSELDALKYTIIDDNAAHKFVYCHLGSISKFTVRTPVFLKNACMIDGVLCGEFVLGILRGIGVAIKSGKKPLYLDEMTYKIYISPVVDAIMVGGTS